MCVYIEVFLFTPEVSPTVQFPGHSVYRITPVSCRFSPRKMYIERLYKFPYISACLKKIRTACTEQKIVCEGVLSDA